MLTEIKEKLSQIDQNVQIGICKKKNDIWDCLVIRKERLKKSGTSKLDDTFYVSVRIVREDEIASGLEFKIIDAMKEIGWKKSGSDSVYDYTVDSNEVIVEICKMDFYKAKKRVCI